MNAEEHWDHAHSSDQFFIAFKLLRNRWSLSQTFYWPDLMTHDGRLAEHAGQERTETGDNQKKNCRHRHPQPLLGRPFDPIFPCLQAVSGTCDKPLAALRADKLFLCQANGHPDQMATGTGDLKEF